MSKRWRHSLNTFDPGAFIALRINICLGGCYITTGAGPCSKRIRNDFCFYKYFAPLRFNLLRIWLFAKVPPPPHFFIYLLFLFLTIIALISSWLRSPGSSFVNEVGFVVYSKAFVYKKMMKITVWCPSPGSREPLERLEVMLWWWRADGAQGHRALSHCLEGSNHRV